MQTDIRSTTAEYYERFSGPPWDDLPFYRSRLPGQDARVLELGCGTGRVLLPIAEHCAQAVGLELSPAMRAICDRKIAASGLPEERITTRQADISKFDLTDEMAPFDLIFAAFRVMQNLETDAQVDGMMRCIKKHLATGGEAVLNTFMPSRGTEAIQAYWAARDGTIPCWSRQDGDTTVTMADDCTRFGDNPLAVYPKLIYRRFDAAGTQIEESVLDIVMRVWFPDQLIKLVKRHGFTVTHLAGGYQDEVWSEGPELVICFKA